MHRNPCPESVEILISLNAGVLPEFLGSSGSATLDGDVLSFNVPDLADPVILVGSVVKLVEMHY
jgi:hypothetical protein